jgi:pilus assembly protein CpaE
MYQKLLAEHSSGVRLLAAPWEFEEVHSVTPRGIARAISLARESFAQVIVDLEDCFHEEQALVLDQASRILLVCRLEFTAIRNTRHILDHLEMRKIPRDRIEIVVNQFGLPNELPVPEAESAIGGKLMHFVPHDPEAICEANNTGIPVAVKDYESAVAQNIAKLVGLETRTPPPPGSLHRLQNWFRGNVGPCLRKTFSRIKLSTATSGATVCTEEIKETHESVSVPQPATRSGTCPV